MASWPGQVERRHGAKVPGRRVCVARERTWASDGSAAVVAFSDCCTAQAVTLHETKDSELEKVLYLIYY
jgi:hypothetical protein